MTSGIIIKEKRCATNAFLWGKFSDICLFAHNMIYFTGFHTNIIKDDFPKQGLRHQCFSKRKILHNLILIFKRNCFAVYNLYILYFCVFIVLVYVFIVYTLILCVRPLFFSAPRHDTNLRPVSLDSV